MTPFKNCFIIMVYMQIVLTLSIESAVLFDLCSVKGGQAAKVVIN